MPGYYSFVTYFASNTLESSKLEYVTLSDDEKSVQYNIKQ